jgi:hypothetical protein
MLVGEAKFASSPLGYNTLSRLEEDSQHLNIDKDRRYALFSRSGFKRSVRETAKERNDIHLHNLEEIIKGLE